MEYNVNLKTVIATAVAAIILHGMHRQRRAITPGPKMYNRPPAAN